jgi:nitrogen regulatory protein P-II 1
MKKIEATIKPFKLDEVREALLSTGVDSLTVSEVKVLGPPKGDAAPYNGAEYVVDFITQVKLELIVTDAMVSNVVATIEWAARTGRIGDGKIFVMPIEDAIRIRTGEHGVHAI